MKALLITFLTSVALFAQAPVVKPVAVIPAVPVVAPAPKVEVKAPVAPTSKAKVAKRHKKTPNRIVKKVAVPVQ